MANPRKPFCKLLPPESEGFSRMSSHSKDNWGSAYRYLGNLRHESPLKGLRRGHQPPISIVTWDQISMVLSGTHTFFILVLGWLVCWKICIHSNALCGTWPLHPSWLWKEAKEGEGVLVHLFAFAIFICLGDIRLQVSLSMDCLLSLVLAFVDWSSQELF